MDKQSQLKARIHHTRNKVSEALAFFSPVERLGFIICISVAFVTLFIILFHINNVFLVSVPTSGGTLNEGVVGTPRFVNPLLASTDTDKDLTRLVFRGLMKKNETGEIVPDIATEYKVSDDGLTYTFTLGEAYFSDKKKVTADDVLFTIKSAQDATLKSNLRVTWSGVIAKVIDEKTISFTLKQPYAPFIENTTIGILPKHLWEKVPYESWVYSQNNTANSIGAGAYAVKSISEKSSGIPDTYTLKAVRSKNAPETLIDTIVVHFYTNEDALISAYKAGEIDTLGGIDPEDALALEPNAHIESRPLPRVFGLFFNQNTTKIFTDSAVRKAIGMGINKSEIVHDVLKDYGKVINEPIPKILEGEDDASDRDARANPELAKAVLEKAGWKQGDDGIYAKKLNKKDKEATRLSFEIATNDVSELKQAVTIISENLKAIGIEAIPKVYETGSLNQDIIRPRKFQALFFGQVVTNQSDLYAFWHSSQRNDPGLNISGYANTKVDKVLEGALGTLDADKLDDLYASFEKEINADMPAVFVYSPSYIYATRPSATGITLPYIATPEDRFDEITNWYLATDRVWKIFSK